MADAPAGTYYCCTRTGADGRLEAMVAWTGLVLVHHVPGKQSLESQGWVVGQPYASYTEAEAERDRLLDAAVGITPEGII